MVAMVMNVIWFAMVTNAIWLLWLRMQYSCYGYECNMVTNAIWLLWLWMQYGCYGYKCKMVVGYYGHEWQYIHVTTVTSNNIRVLYVSLNNICFYWFFVIFLLRKTTTEIDYQSTAAYQLPSRASGPSAKAFFFPEPTHFVQDGRQIR